MDSNFFALISRMRYIARWGLMRNALPENIQEHSHMVAVLAHALGVIRRDIFHQPCDVNALATAALYHDASEILTGDLPTPIKYHNAEIMSAYHAVEDLAVQKLLGMLPPELRATYADVLAEDKDGDIYPLVKAADKLSAYIKCIEARKPGNNEFLSAAAPPRAAPRPLLAVAAGIERPGRFHPGLQPQFPAGRRPAPAEWLEAAVARLPGRRDRRSPPSARSGGTNADQTALHKRAAATDSPAGTTAPDPRHPETLRYDRNVGRSLPAASAESGTGRSAGSISDNPRAPGDTGCLANLYRRTVTAIPGATAAFSAPPVAGHKQNGRAVCPAAGGLDHLYRIWHRIR